MSDDFYPFVDSGDPAPDNAHITGGGADELRAQAVDMNAAEQVSYATRIAIYDDMLSTPRVIVIAPKDVRTYLEEITNTVYRCMKEQGGGISLMVIREIVENFIHANFVEPIISILDDGNTIRFADQGPGIDDKERAFEFGVTSADRNQKRYIRGTGAGFPMVQQYLENAGGAVSIEDNLHQGTVVTVSIDPARAAEIERAHGRGAAVRGAAEVEDGAALGPGAPTGAGGQAAPAALGTPMPDGAAPTGFAAAQAPYPGAAAGGGSPWQAAGYPPQPYGYQQPYPGAGRSLGRCTGCRHYGRCRPPAAGRGCHREHGGVGRRGGCAIGKRLHGGGKPHCARRFGCHLLYEKRSEGRYGRRGAGRGPAAAVGGGASGHGPVGSGSPVRLLKVVVGLEEAGQVELCHKRVAHKQV